MNCQFPTELGKINMPLPGLENPSAPSEGSITSNNIENHFKQSSWCVVMEDFFFSFCNEANTYYENSLYIYSVPVAICFSQQQSFLRKNQRIVGTSA